MNIVSEFAGQCVGFYDSTVGISITEAAITNPSAFDNAAWTKTNASVSANSTTDPFGGSAADKLVEDGTNAGHSCTQVATNIVLSRPMEVSIYAKAAGRSWFLLAADGGGSGCYFNLAAGTVGTKVGGCTGATCVPVGNGWYQLTIQVTPGANSTIDCQLASADTVFSYQGDGGSGVYLYQAAVTQPKVSQWSDQSLASDGTANGHHITQAAAGAMALYIYNGWNGRPVLRFDGSDDLLKSSAFTLNQPIWGAIAYRMISLGANSVHDLVMDGNTLISGSFLSDSGPETYIYAGSAGCLFAGNIANGTMDTVDWTMNGVSSVLRRRDVQVASGNAGASNPGGFCIGGSATPSRWTNFDIAFLALFNAIPSTYDQSRIARFMRSRFSPILLS